MFRKRQNFKMEKGQWLPGVGGEEENWLQKTFFEAMEYSVDYGGR